MYIEKLLKKCFFSVKNQLLRRPGTFEAKQNINTIWDIIYISTPQNIYVVHNINNIHSAGSSWVNNYTNSGEFLCNLLQKKLKSVHLI